MSFRNLLGSPTVEKKTATWIVDSQKRKTYCIFGYGAILMLADKNLFSLPFPTPLISSNWGGEPVVSKLKRLQIENISWHVLS